MPLLGMRQEATIWGTAYRYGHPAAYQFFELRLCPAYALALLVVAFVWLAVRGQSGLSGSKPLFAAAAGLLAFGLFRAVVTRSFGGNLLWATFWEEATESIGIAGIAWTLYVFRSRLLICPDQPGPSAR
jgi:hypothetical protein